jgi:hypothetical protein
LHRLSLEISKIPVSACNCTILHFLQRRPVSAGGTNGDGRRPRKLSGQTAATGQMFVIRFLGNCFWRSGTATRRPFHDDFEGIGFSIYDLRLAISDWQVRAD